MKLLERFTRRFVSYGLSDRNETYKVEASRIRRGDPLSWLLIATGMLPLMSQSAALIPVWIMVSLAAYAARRRSAYFSPESANTAALVSALTAIAYFAATGDRLWAFCMFLVLVTTVLIVKQDLSVEVPRVYLVCFVLFLVDRKSTRLNSSHRL